MAAKSLTVVAIPAYNAEKTIAKVIVMSRGYADRIIVCDDGSTDFTGKIARSLGAEVIAHSRNMGYGAALSSLFAKSRETGADIMVTMDADGQHDPRLIPKLLAPLLEGEADIVIGSRFLNFSSDEMPQYRRGGVKAITKLADKIAYAGLSDAQSGFRAYNKKSLALLRPTEMGMGASTELLSKAKDADLKIAEVPTQVSYDEGSSSSNPIYHALDVVLSMVKHLSIRHPLMFYGFPGLVSSLIAIGFWWWTLSIFVETRRIVTNIALIAVASTVVGLVLLAVAIILWVMVSVVRER